MSDSSVIRVRPITSRFNLSSLIVDSTYRLEWPYLVLTMSILVAFDIYKAVANPLWFDEFMTLFIGRLPSYAEMLKAMPVDGQPPLNYIVTHFSIAWFGSSELAIRSPELFAYTIAGLLTYKITRIHGSPAQSLFATTVVMHAPIARQAFTARPYGMLLAFTALAFLSWQRAATTEKKRLIPLCGVSIGLAGAILSHQFGILQVGLFLLAGEAVRFIQTRKIDRWMLAAILAGCLAMAMTLPLALEARHTFLWAVLKYSVPGSLQGIRTLKQYLFEANIVLLLLPFCIGVPLALTAPQAAKSEAAPIAPFEWAAVTALCLLLPVVYVVCVFSTGQFVSRYAIGSSLGLALFAAWVLPKCSPLRKGADLSFFISTVWFVSLLATRVYHAQRYQPIWHAQPQIVAVSSVLDSAPGDLPIVVASALDYPQEWWYSRPELRDRMVYLADTSFALASKKGFELEMSLTVDQKIIPMPIKSYKSFLQQNPHFCLLSSGPNVYVWTPERLSEEGWRLTTIARSGKDVLYVVERH